MSLVRSGQTFGLFYPGSNYLARLIVIACFLTAAPQVNAQGVLALPNRWCPVKTGELASSEHKITRGGSEVWFCCDECKTSFVQDPDRYLENLRESFQGESREEVAPDQARPAVSPTEFEILTRGLLPYKNALILILVFLLLFLVAKRYKARRKKNDPIGLLPKSPLISALAKPQTLLILMQLAILFHFIFWDNDESSGPVPMIIRKADDSAEIILRVLSRQPDISEQFMAEAGAGLQPRLDPAYEISSDAVQSAALIRLSLRTAAGTPVRNRTKLSEEQLYLHLELDMSKLGHGPLFSVEDLSQMTLLSIARSEAQDQPASIGTEIRLMRSSEANRWHARYPLGEISEPSNYPLRKAGTLYVCLPSARQSGIQTLDTARFAINYSVLVREGSIDDSSAIWLTCLRQEQKNFRSRRQTPSK